MSLLAQGRTPPAPRQARVAGPGPDAPPPPSGQRTGVIVMLVDNDVHGDSRVQKAARSAAQAGWKVTLLGCSPDGREHAWTIGDAEVRLLPMPPTLARRPRDFRRPWLRAPLAYPPNGIAARQRQRVMAWRADLQARLAAVGAGNDTPRRWTAGTPRAWTAGVLRARLVLVKVLGRWVRVRARALHRAQRARRRRGGPIDRLHTAFWRAVGGRWAWRRLDPALWDFEMAFGPTVDSLCPDLIHANDHRMLGVGARAKLRAIRDGRPVKLVWDAHEYLPGVTAPEGDTRWLPAQVAHEREYAPYADATVTVSETLADLLTARHGLARRPAVVLNVPALDHMPAQEDLTAGDDVPDLRALCGVGQDVPLLVYSGAAAPHRGLDIIVEALPHLGGVHAALVINRPAGAYARHLLATADALGVADRLHLLPYVPYWQVVPFLAAADMGVIAMHQGPNHEIAVNTKYFEYSHARLPLVVSDVRTIAEATRTTGNGEVFRARDTDDFVGAVRRVLADPARYRAPYDRPGVLDAWTWQTQARILHEVYASLMG